MHTHIDTCRLSIFSWGSSDHIYASAWMHMHTLCQIFSASPTPRPSLSLSLSVYHIQSKDHKNYHPPPTCHCRYLPRKFHSLSLYHIQSRARELVRRTSPLSWLSCPSLSCSTMHNRERSPHPRMIGTGRNSDSHHKVKWNFSTG